MKITEIVILLENKLATLNNSIQGAQASGDLVRFSNLESEIYETELALSEIRKINL